jgi:hypothetical protein
MNGPGCARQHELAEFISQSVFSTDPADPSQGEAAGFKIDGQASQRPAK